MNQVHLEWVTESFIHKLHVILFSCLTFFSSESWEKHNFHWEKYIYCDESAASPLIISISPSLNRRPSPGSRREWVCERGGALKTSRSGGVWWGTPEVNGASSPPLLYAECASPRETGLFPVHARWCPRGSRKGAVEGASAAPVTRLTGQDAGPYNPRRCRGPKEDEAATRSRRPSRSDPRGERVRLPDSAPYLDPSFQNTAPPSQPAQHDEDTRSPVYFGHFIPFGHYFIISVE